MFISMTLLSAMNARGAGGHGWVPMNSANLNPGGNGGVCVCSRVRAWACMRDVFAIYDYE